MRLIGLLGGLSWDSTSLYYRMLNEFTRKELGGHHGARVLLHSVNHAAVKEAQSRGDTETVIAILSEAGRSLKAGGADFMVLANNSLHQYAEEIERDSGLELLHISDATSAQVRQAGHQTVALLGTRITMESDFYSKHLKSECGATVISPDLGERIEVNRVIHDELGRGIMRNGSREFINQLIETLCERGAEAVILGCSELTTLITPAPEPIHFYDTTRLHAKAAVQRALELSYA